jgi:5-methylcytosine-specific restriction endonuclease McrA
MFMNQSHHRDNFITNELHKNLGAEACAAAEFLVLLQELDATRGWARLGYASLFNFCHLNLNLTRAEAYSRTRLARLAGEVPQVLSLLRSGEIKLSALRILAPVLTPENFNAVFANIRGKTTREVEDYRNRFRIHEKPATRGCVRTMYSSRENGPMAAPGDSLFTPTQCSGEAVSPDKRVAAALVQSVGGKGNGALDGDSAKPAEGLPPLQKSVRMALTLNEELWEKYCRACNLSNHSSNGADAAEMMEMLLDHYLKKHDGVPKQNKKTPLREPNCEASVGADSVTQQKEHMEQKEPSSVTDSGAKEMRSAGASRCRSAVSPRGEKTSHKEQPSRYIPKQVRHEVRERDGNRCAYVDATTGKRCDCERGLQYDHILPFARGGASNTSRNLRLLCPTHNRLAAEHVFGAQFMNQKMRAGVFATSQIATQ